MVFWICDLPAPHRPTLVSPGIRTLLGLTPEECVGSTTFWTDRVHAEDWTELMARLGRIGRTGRETIECRFAHRDGTYRWVHGAFVLTKAAGGEPREIAGIWYDVSARRRTDAQVAPERAADRELLGAEERYRELFENANDLVFTTDLELNFTSLNPAGEIVTGYPRAEALRLKATDVVPPDAAVLIRQRLERMLAGRPVPMLETEVIAADGRRIPVEVNTRLIFRNGRPVGVQGIARNISERRALEAQVRQAQKLEALGRLAGGIAHDFNNLLTVILACCEDLSSRATPGAPDPSVETIRTTAERAAVLTRQLLTFGRRQPAAARTVNLNTVIAGVCRMVERLIGEDVQLITTLAPDLHDVRADPGQVEQVIMNLVLNARDAMPQGGRLVITTANLPAAAGQTPRPPSVSLTVRDSGGGMDAETEARIFEPFFTTKTTGKGSGLGLSTVYGIVKSLGGHIGVQTRRGAGTTFTLTFPALIAAPEAAEPAGANGDVHRRAGGAQ